MTMGNTPRGKKTFVGGGQFGSESKGSVVGWLARRHPYTAGVCAFPPSSGHTYMWEGKTIMNIMLPISVVGQHVRELFIGPGALIDVERLKIEIDIAEHMGLLENKRILIHEHAGVVLPQHSESEKTSGLTNIGSTVKGGMAAHIDKMRRDPDDQWVAREKLQGTGLERYVVGKHEYLAALMSHDDVLIEGSQGFGLSMHHGFYPYTTARDTTPWAVAMDCGLPWSWASEIETIWVMRTFPIRVNNRTGNSGPAYSDSIETSFPEIGQPTELTTVTKLPRRIFTFSRQQLGHLRDQCFNEKSQIALTFCNYMEASEKQELIRSIESAGTRVTMTNYGPDDSEMWARNSPEKGSNKNDVFGAVILEREFQDTVHGTDPHGMGTWLLLIESELDEAKLAAVKGGTGRNSVRNELVQVAALCVAALEQHGVTSDREGREV